MTFILSIQKLIKANIPHIVIGGDKTDDVNEALIKRLAEGEFQAVFMSPEIIFGTSPTSAKVQDLWKELKWRNILTAIVVDEVHCIQKWGGKFRRDYDRLGDLRIWAPGVPFLGVTATITSQALLETSSKLFLNNASILRVEEMPTNVRIELHTQPKDAIIGLSRFLNGHKTIIYFDQIATLLAVSEFLNKSRKDLLGRVGCYYAILSPQLKEDTMVRFVKGNICVLLATEAAGMGCDIPDIVQVIQYGYVYTITKERKNENGSVTQTDILIIIYILCRFPKDISSLIQRFGRAARDRTIKGYGVLYAPPVTKLTKLDPNIRELFEHNTLKKCLWALIDTLFDNKIRDCGDLCSGCSLQDRAFDTTVSRDTKPKKRIKGRTAEEKDMALKILYQWRDEKYETWASDNPFAYGYEIWFLPDAVAKRLSQKFSGATTAQAVKDITTSYKYRWTPFDDDDSSFESIAQLLSKLNDEIDACNGSRSQLIANCEDNGEVSDEWD